MRVRMSSGVSRNAHKLDSRLRGNDGVWGALCQFSGSPPAPSFFAANPRCLRLARVRHSLGSGNPPFLGLRKRACALKAAARCRTPDSDIFTPRPLPVVEW